MNVVSRTRLRHVAGTAAGLAVFALVFMYSGDADLWTAIGCGIATALLFYFSAHLRDTGSPDGSA
jgi:hypothetical protein